MAFFRCRRRKIAPPTEGEKNRELVEQIDKARKEWDLAQSQLDQMSEPDLIDYAVYRLQAAEKRYMYLLKKADEKGIRRSISHSLSETRPLKG